MTNPMRAIRMMTPAEVTRWLGIDPGGARIGLAISDPGGGYAIPLNVVSASAAFPAIRAIVQREGVSGIVIGIARLPSGDEGESAQLARRLGARLTRLGVPIEYEDETLTSHQAESMARSGGASRRRPADDVAAALILQQFLDRRMRAGRRDPETDA
ncbi:MAG: Holliday junction resolvase RuvX [Chloroflexi bacterium]|nr:Holliday junction resolvase RuvX [Chloroflexota bacterium]